MIIKKILSYLLIIFLLGILMITFYSKYILKQEIVKIFDCAFLVVLTGSMEPNIHSGELIIIKEQTDYIIGDVVTYVDKSGDFITHRIISKDNELYTTQGDSNNIVDQKINYLQIEGKVIFHSLFLGYFVLYLLKPITLIYMFILLAIEMKRYINSDKKDGECDEVKESD